MKKVFIAAFVCFIVYGCSPKLDPQRPYSGEVNYIGKEVQGTITLRAAGYGKNQIEAISDAHKNAFSILMFKGIPGTDQNVPLIDNEHEAKAKNKEFFKNFFDNGFYDSYVMYSSKTSNLTDGSDVAKKKTKKKETGEGAWTKTTVDIKINLNSLRKNLEQNQIIRKFGY